MSGRAGPFGPCPSTLAQHDPILWVVPCWASLVYRPWRPIALVFSCWVVMGLDGPAQFTILSMDPFKSGPRPTNLTRLLDCVVMTFWITFWIWKQKRIIYWSLFLSYAGEQLQTYCNGVQWVAPHLGPIMFWWVLGFIPPDPNLYFFLLMTLISLLINNMYANVRDNYFFIKCSTCLPPEKKEKKREDNPNQTCHKLCYRMSLIMHFMAPTLPCKYSHYWARFVYKEINI